MQFSSRPVKGRKPNKTNYVVNIELAEGSIFLMSAVCDRLLLHEVFKQGDEDGDGRTAIILRVLDQPRFYKTTHPFNICDNEQQ